MKLVAASRQRSIYPFALTTILLYKIPAVSEYLPLKIPKPYLDTLSGQGEQTRTADLTAPSRTRYQLRHTLLNTLDQF